MGEDLLGAVLLLFCDYLTSQDLSLPACFLLSHTIGKHSGQGNDLRDPAAVYFQLEFNWELLFEIEWQGIYLRG